MTVKTKNTYQKYCIIFISVFLVFGFISFIAADDVFAAHGPHIISSAECTGETRGAVIAGEPVKYCTECDFLHMLQHIMQFAIWHIAPLAAALMFVWGGILMLMPYLGGGGSAMLEKGKKILWTTVIGLLIIFLSWTIVNTIIITLVDGSVLKDWSQIKCTQPNVGGKSEK